MSNPQPEPSMEEILASIRRIISEDEEEAAPAAATKSAAAPQPPRARPQPPQPRPALVSGPAVALGEDDRASPNLKTEDVEMIKKSTAAMSDDTTEEILAETTATVASKAFQSLSQSVRISRGEGRTLEDIVIDLLKPMVKEWLDANLPQIVEEKVEEEVQRVARRRGQ